MDAGLNSAEEATYQIQLRGRLRESWSKWFEDAIITGRVLEDGHAITTITCEHLDQAALHGILTKIRDLNLVLLSVARLEGQSKHREECDEF